jgi:hypothetical protein
MENPDIFLITSVINTGNKAWNYTGIRSVFNEEERFNQTLKTIQSIRDLKDGSKIMLVECSNLKEEYETALKKNVDIYQQLYNDNDNDIRGACLDSSKKGYGEVLKTRAAVNYLITNDIGFERIFKISGRYWLNDRFDKSKFPNNKFVFRAPQAVWPVVPTVLYMVPKSLLTVYLQALDQCDELFKSGDQCYEAILPPRCRPRVLLEYIGVSGLVAYNNQLYES